MSGGAFDYHDNILYDLQDDVARELGLIEYGRKDNSYDISDKTVSYMKDICKQLGNLGDILHSLDWFLSGDTGEDKFIEDYESIIGRK